LDLIAESIDLLTHVLIQRLELAAAMRRVRRQRQRRQERMALAIPQRVPAPIRRASFSAARRECRDRGWRAIARGCFSPTHGGIVPAETIRIGDAPPDLLRLPVISPNGIRIAL